VTLTRQYDAWGNLDAGAGEPGYSFTGREWDPEIDLYYYRARYHDSRIGRFLSEDPIQVRARAAREMNAYVYVANDPVNHTDPTGLVIFETCVQRIAREVERDYCAKPGTPGGNSRRGPGDRSCREAHCITNCRISRECFGGAATAAAASVAKEVYDEVKQNVWDRSSAGWDPGDMTANKKGRVCGTSPFAKRWDCEELCRGTR
jgi:RHS repeat-associated protein